MGPQGVFGGTITTLEKVLDLRSIKHNMIISNIANIDTPNYKAFDLVIEEELGKVMGTEKNIELKRSHPGHIPVKEIRLDNVRSKVVASPQLTLKGDGNSVDIDKVMANLAENSLMYNTFARILSKKFIGLKTAIQGGK